MFLYQQSEGTAAQRRVFLHLVDATDGITPETGEAAGQPQLSKNGAAFGSTTATLTAVANGLYYVELTGTELDTVGMIAVRYKSANTAEAQVLCQVIPWDPYDTVRIGLTALPNAAAEAAGGLYTRGSGAGQVNQNANGQVDTRTVTMSTDVVTAAAIAADAIGASELAAGAVTEIRSLASGTSDSGSTTTMVDAARTEGDTDYWKGSLIVFTSGTIAGQSRYITAFDAATDTITFAPATTQVVGTQTYEIWPTADFLRPTATGRTLDVSAGGEAGLDWANIGSPTTAQNLSATNIDVDQIVASVSGAVGSVTGLTAATVHSDLDDIQARLPAALTADGNIKADTLRVSGTLQTAGDIPAMVTAVDDFVDTEVATILTRIGTPTDLGGGATLSFNLSDIEAQTDDIGAAGAGLTALATQASVNTIDDFLDTEIAAILAAVDTEVGAIKAVTDLLIAAYAEPTGVPAADESPLEKLAYLFMALRNKLDVTATKKTFYDDGGLAEWEKDLSDDGTTYAESEANVV